MMAQLYCTKNKSNHVGANQMSSSIRANVWASATSMSVWSFLHTLSKKSVPSRPGCALWLPPGRSLRLEAASLPGFVAGSSPHTRC